MKRFFTAFLIVIFACSFVLAETGVRELPLNGRLRTADDPVTIGPSDFAQLTNLRYAGNNPKGIGGMTKINTSALSNPQIKNGAHFTRVFPTAESHVLVSARDSNGANQKVYRNDTAIPSAGAFASAPLFTDTSGYGIGRFSQAPDGIAYANGKNTVLWLGDEATAAGFIDYDPAGTYRYDWTDQVSNNLTDSNNVATLHRATGSIDNDTMLLLSLNDNVTDTSPVTAHTVTNNNVTFSTSSEFGSHAAVFNGTTANLTVPDNADFDLSGGAWTIDFWIYPTDLSSQKVMYYQQDNTSNYMVVKLAALSGGPTWSNYTGVALSIYSGGSEVVEIHTSNSVITTNAWHHVAVVESGNNFYIFVNGYLRGSGTDTSRAADYGGTVYLGSDAVPGTYYTGRLDEFRVSKVARWTAAFEPPTRAYTDSGITSLYVRSMIPASGVKFYVGTANATAATASAFEWSGTGWSAVSSFADGTSASGKSLAQTGSMTWTGTDNTSVTKIIDGVQGYWYKIEISGAVGLDTTTTVSQVSVLSNMQQIRDIWDGTNLSVGSFQKYASSSYQDFSTNVFENEYDSANTATFVELDGLAAATDALYAGFPNRLQALRTNIIGGHVNTTAGTVLSVSYWNGTAWISVGTVDDGTSEAGVSFAKSGTIAWNPAGIVSEHKRVLAGAKKTDSLYYYKLSFSQNLSADVQVYHVSGIPAQVDLRGYKFPLYHLGRLCLGNNADSEPNKLFCTIPNSSHIFNGPDSIALNVGDGKGLTGAASVYSRFGSTLNSVALLFKDAETWVWLGTTSEDLKLHQLSPSIGCNAPLTIKVVPAFDTAEGSGGIGRSIAIWQGASGVYMSDGASIAKISNDIRDKFDPLHANYVGAATLATCTAAYDPVNDEYHWIIPGVGEWVYDLRKSKWFQIDRGSGKYLQCAVEVTDTNGNPYLYGALSTGYLERLEYGTTFDGGAGIVHTLRTGDIALHNGSILRDTTIKRVKVVQLAKTVTANTPTLTHFGDSKTTGTTYNTYSATSSGKRLAFTTPPDIRLGPYQFHGLKLTQTTSDETAPGFEPFFIGIYYETASDLIQ